jgi:hypothetical protein
MSMSANPLRLVGAIAVVAVAWSAAARAAAPAGHYTFPATGSVFDTKTKLTWQRTAPAATYAWAAAKTYCAGLSTTLGGTGWRLPTIKELQTIVDETQVAPPIDSTAFPGTPANAFWSSTQTKDSAGAWFVDFGPNTSGGTTSDNVSAAYNVRCVR